MLRVDYTYRRHFKQALLRNFRGRKLRLAHLPVLAWRRVAPCLAFAARTCWARFRACGLCSRLWRLLLAVACCLRRKGLGASPVKPRSPTPRGAPTPRAQRA